MFGPEYQKIQTLFLRTGRGVIIPGQYTMPQFEYLANNPWRWTEKVDGTNLRLHWNGARVTIGGRTDNAQVPAAWAVALEPWTDPELWRPAFDNDVNSVTVYGEAYGKGINKGHQYRPDMSIAVFDVKIGDWWLKPSDVYDVANKLNLSVVPLVGEFPLVEAWDMLTNDKLVSAWDGANIEGLVGTPAAQLFDQAGDRIITKMKVKDWRDYLRRSGEVTVGDTTGATA